MDTEIKIINPSDILSAMNLIEECFDLFVAPDYSNKGIETFKNKYINNQKFIDKFIYGTEKMYGAYMEDLLVGCISISINNTISCCFVKAKYHRMGIATLLFKTVRNELAGRNVNIIKLNASPYAVPFYRAIGFLETGEEAEYEGIRYTPMLYEIK